MEDDKMLTTREARDFLRDSSPLTIFYRAVLYNVWLERDYKPCGRLVILIIVAAFCGKFDEKNLDDPQIKDLIEKTEWGHNYDSNRYLDVWVRTLVKNNDDIIYLNEISQIIKNKIDDIDDYFKQNAREDRTFSDYFGLSSDWPIV
jgi:hypothetical protein